MTNRVKFFMTNYEENPLQVTEDEHVISYIGLKDGTVVTEKNMDIFLLHSLVYPNPIISVVIHDGDEYNYSYIDIKECRYVQPVIYATGDVTHKIYTLNDVELELLDNCMWIPSCTCETTYRELLIKSNNYFNDPIVIKEVEDKLIDLKLLNKIRYKEAKVSDYIPDFRNLRKEEKKCC